MYCIGGNGCEGFSQNGIIEQWQPVLVYQKAPIDKNKIPKNINQDHQHTDKGISFFINMLSSEGNIIFDPMVETDDVLKIAKSLNRKVIGVEKVD